MKPDEREQIRRQLLNLWNRQATPREAEVAIGCIINDSERGKDAEISALRDLISRMVDHFDDGTCPYDCDECKPIVILEEAKACLATSPAKGVSP